MILKLQLSLQQDAKSQRKLLLTVVLAACDIETTTITTTSVKDGDRFNSIFLPYLRPSNKWHNSNSSPAPDHFAQLYTHYGNQSCCDLKMEYKKKNQALQFNDTVLLNGEPLYPYFMKKISQVWTCLQEDLLHIDVVLLYPEFLKKEGFSRLKFVKIVVCSESDVGLDLVMALSFTLDRKNAVRQF